MPGLAAHRHPVCRFPGSASFQQCDFPATQPRRPSVIECKFPGLAAHPSSGCPLIAYASHQSCELPAVEILRTSSATFPFPIFPRIVPPYSGSLCIHPISVASGQQVLAAGPPTSIASCPPFQRIHNLDAGCPGFLHRRVPVAIKSTSNAYG